MVYSQVVTFPAGFLRVLLESILTTEAVLAIVNSSVEARSPVWVKWDSRRSLDPSEFQLALLSSELFKQHRRALLFKLPVFQEFVYTYLCLTKIGAPTPRMLDELRRHNGIQSGALKSFPWAVTLSWDGSGQGLMRSWTERIPGGRKSVEQCWED